MRSRVTVGDVGEAYRLERDDGWEVDGTVLVKEPPYRLRVTWRIKTPPDVVMPNCDVEYLIEPALIPGAKSTTKLTVNSYVDGPVPPPFLNASRTGWAMITRNLKDYLGERSFERAPTTRRDAVLASGAQLLSTDYPASEPSAWTAYSVSLPDGAVARCNPVNGPAFCSNKEFTASVHPE